MKKIGLIILSFLLFFSCEEDPFGYEIEYQDGNPNKLVGNWKVYEYPGNRESSLSYEAYDLITALDPNSEDSIVFSNLYNSSLRVKVGFSDLSFSVYKGKQLEVLNKAYDVEKISIYGKLVEADIGDVLVFLSIFYDAYNSPVDSVVVNAFRKTGFEEVDQYDYDFLFDD